MKSLFTSMTPPGTLSPLQVKLKALYRSQLMPKLITDALDNQQPLPPQSFDSLYVIPKLTFKDSDGNAQNIPEIKQLIKPLDASNSIANKILLIGDAGSGKTTLMHYITHEWGRVENGLWGNRFDYVLRVRLKKLGTDSWKKGPGEIEDPLSTLIKDTLAEQLVELKMTQREEWEKLQLKAGDILEVLKEDKSKILLLLDGFDEIAHLAYNNNHIAREVMDDIFKGYHNIIMTSRHNTILPNDTVLRFDKKIENTGFDPNRGVEEYVEKYFSTPENTIYKDTLLTFLEQNLQVKSICSTPIHAAMMCGVWALETTSRSAAEINVMFPQDFTVTDLYSKVVLWLGRKYVYNNRSTEDHLKKFVTLTSPAQITPKEVYELPELRTLRDFAYETFKKQESSHDTRVVHPHSLLGSIREKHGLAYAGEDKFGLLGRSVDDTPNSDNLFIHSTFHGYMFAQGLQERLLTDRMTDGETIAQATIWLIGEYRTDPQYLIPLKFLAGLVNSNPGPDREKLVTKFWEAVTCNVDGILELGLEARIELWMHLLSEWGANLPKKVERVVSLVDYMVINNLTFFADAVSSSRYSSSNIKHAALAIMGRSQNKDTIFTLKKTIIDALYQDDYLQEFLTHIPDCDPSFIDSDRAILQAINIIIHIKNNLTEEEKVEALNLALQLLSIESVRSASVLLIKDLMAFKVINQNVAILQSLSKAFVDLLMEESSDLRSIFSTIVELSKIHSSVKDYTLRLLEEKKPNIALSEVTYLPSVTKYVFALSQIELVPCASRQSATEDEITKVIGCIQNQVCDRSLNLIVLMSVLSRIFSEQVLTYYYGSAFISYAFRVCTENSDDQIFGVLLQSVCEKLSELPRQVALPLITQVVNTILSNPSTFAEIIPFPNILLSACKALSRYENDVEELEVDRIVSTLMDIFKQEFMKPYMQDTENNSALLIILAEIMKCLLPSCKNVMPTKLVLSECAALFKAIVASRNKFDTSPDDMKERVIEEMHNFWNQWHDYVLETMAPLQEGHQVLENLRQHHFWEQEGEEANNLLSEYIETHDLTMQHYDICGQINSRFYVIVNLIHMIFNAGCYIDEESYCSHLDFMESSVDIAAFEIYGFLLSDGMRSKVLAKPKLKDSIYQFCLAQLDSSSDTKDKLKASELLLRLRIEDRNIFAKIKEVLISIISDEREIINHILKIKVIKMMSEIVDLDPQTTHKDDWMILFYQSLVWLVNASNLEKEGVFLATSSLIELIPNTIKEELQNELESLLPENIHTRLYIYCLMVTFDQSVALKHKDIIIETVRKTKARSFVTLDNDEEDEEVNDNVYAYRLLNNFFLNFESCSLIESRLAQEVVASLVQELVQLANYGNDHMGILHVINVLCVIFSTGQKCINPQKALEFLEIIISSGRKIGSVAVFKDESILAAQNLAEHIKIEDLTQYVSDDNFGIGLRRALTDKILFLVTQIEAGIHKCTLEDVKGYLALTGLKEQAQSRSQKDLTQAVQKLIDAQMRTLNDEKLTKEEIESVTHDYMTTLHFYTSGMYFYTHVLHKIFETGCINKPRSDFIVECIKSGLSLSLNRGGAVSFEGRKYILKDPESKFLLEEIVGKLAKEQKPLFCCSDTSDGLKVAARDIPNSSVRSIFGHHKTSQDGWLVSIFDINDVEQCAILESRDHFGYRVIYKIGTDGNIKVSKIMHPLEVTRDDREALLGELTVQHLEYTVSSIQIPIHTTSNSTQDVDASTYSRSILESIKQALSHGLTLGFQQLKDSPGVEIITPDPTTVSIKTLLNIDPHSQEGMICDLERGQLETQTTLSDLKVVATQHREDIDLLFQDIRTLSISFTKHDTERKEWEDNINTEVTKLMQSDSITKGKILKLRQDIKADAQRLTVHLQDHSLSSAAGTVSVVSDNPLTKYPTLFAKAIEKFGEARTLYLSSQLSQSLIDEAVRSNDPEILLVGLTSLEIEHSSHA